MSQPRSLSLRIGALAQDCGLSRDTLRHYERLGLLPTPSRTAGGFREYPEGAARRVRVIQRALAIGFSLSELGVFFHERAVGRTPCRRVRALAGEKLVQLEREIAQLQRLRRDLGKTLAAWDVRLAQTGEGQPARLLDGLADDKERTVRARVQRPSFRRSRLAS